VNLWARFYDAHEKLKQARSVLLRSVNHYLDDPNIDTKEQLMENVYWYEFWYNEFNKLLDGLEQELKKNKGG
jgi:hypothetical protein